MLGTVKVMVLRSARGRAPLSAMRLRGRARRMLEALGLPRAELSILLCGDQAMRALNRQHRRIDRSTDVLAFAMREGEPAPARRMLGDVVISEPTARRNAAVAGRKPSEEITFLLAHGLLHLLGHDHVTKTEERRMTARTHMLVAAATDARSGRVDRSGRGPRTRAKPAARRAPKRPKKTNHHR